ncbi:hypothetical protein JMN32_12620 [Fulvivirga sp. 29W222]|uniref:Uncharacterized protein n=1 Tax=Fulvivirga marina TaxID=2494733 RepID=A0A937FY62_9BACT|nr:hypothetical protein [Fulvivirga marina]MBL6447157.1 hypothetical protein [Fulvivirga marina]
MVSFEHLNGILNKITPAGGNETFKIECIYSDGMGYTILMIYFFNIPDLTIFGRIAFEQESGRVQKCIFRNHCFGRCDNIIDALLDVYNYQRSV